MDIEDGFYCACVVGNNGFQGGRVEVRYDVEKCINYGCKNQVCLIRRQRRDLSKVNVFYDIRRTWITRLGFLKEKRVEVTKGVKVFDKPITKTDAEIWLKVRQAKFNPTHDESIIKRPRKSSEDRRQEHFTKFHRKWEDYDYFEFHYAVENVRIEKREHKDILQDLRDVAEGIEIIHEADRLRAAKEQKQARREDRKENRIRQMERLILQCGWEGLGRNKQQRAKKLLGANRIKTLLQTRSEKESDAPETEQISLFEQAVSE